MSETPMVTDETPVDIEEVFRRSKAERDAKAMQMRRDARTVFAAMEGWQRVTTAEAWQETCRQAGADYRSGRFFVERLGSSRHLEPALMATLWAVRQNLVAEGNRSASEMMLADLAVTSYYNAQRIQRWIGDLAIAVEAEFFGQAGPSAQFTERYGRVEGLVVEAQLERLAEELLPLQERANRMLIRNLKALADLRRGPAPTVAIARAGQVNVGAQQVNVGRSGEPSPANAGPKPPLSETEPLPAMPSPATEDGDGRSGWSGRGSQGGRETQNSLPSGSAMIQWDCTGSSAT